MGSDYYAGRNLIFQTPEELQAAVDGYFDAIDAHNAESDLIRKNPTISGLAYHLNMDRRSLYNYSKRDEFAPVYRRAILRLSAMVEELLLFDNNPTGKIFWLKNHGWEDKTQQEVTQTVTMGSVEMDDGKPLTYNIGSKAQDDDE